MAEILPRHYIIAIIFFIFTIIGGVTLINSMIADNPAYLDSTDADSLKKFNDTFNKLDDINESVSNIRTNIELGDTDFGVFGVLNSLINSAWNSLKSIYTSFSFMNSVFNGLESIFGVPGWASSLIILAIVVLISFAIWSAIFQREV